VEKLPNNAPKDLLHLALNKVDADTNLADFNTKEINKKVKFWLLLGLIP
jgi:hypothetical protein